MADLLDNWRFAATLAVVLPIITGAAIFALGNALDVWLTNRERRG